MGGTRDQIDLNTTVRLFKSGLSKHILAEFILAFVTIIIFIPIMILPQLLFSLVLNYFLYDLFSPCFYFSPHYYTITNVLLLVLIYLMVIFLSINIFLPDYLFFHYIFVSLLSSSSYYLSPFIILYLLLFIFPLWFSLYDLYNFLHIIFCLSYNYSSHDYISPIFSLLIIN